ncbi:LysR family transcriptional regulator, partial [Stenotrophomonas maltophilia]
LQDQAQVDIPPRTRARRHTHDAFVSPGQPHTVRFEVNQMEQVERFGPPGLAVGKLPAQIAQGNQSVVRN